MMSGVDLISQVEKRISSLAKDPLKARHLLDKEKERRGLESSDLVFVGMANVANFKWCAWKSVLASRRNEIEFFLAYLEDKLGLAATLGLIKELPEEDEDMLSIGDELTFEDASKILNERLNQWKNGYLINSKEIAMIISAWIYNLEDGTKLTIVNP